MDSGLEPQPGLRGIEVHPGGKIPGLGVQGPGGRGPGGGFPSHEPVLCQNEESIMISSLSGSHMILVF